MSGAAYTIAFLEEMGIRTIAGIPGGANLPLYDALASSSRIHHVLARHEQGAGFIAHGMARSSGQPAVVFATSGPGATNVLTAIADAKLDSVPLICISGQVPTAMIGTDAFQEIDVFGMSLPVTKHNYLVNKVEDLPRILHEALSIATGGRPGPVWIDIPKDVQMATFDAPAPAFSPGCESPLTNDSIPSAALDQAAAMIEAARKPILYVGGGIIASDTANLIRSISRRQDIPVTMTLMGLGILPPSDPRSLGMLGMHAARYTNMALDEADLLIALGVRFDDRATGKVADFCPRAKVIHIDIDRSELGKIRNPSLGLQGDLSRLLPRLAERLPDAERPAWRMRIEELKRNHTSPASHSTSLTDPLRLIDAVARIAGPEAIVTTDVGQHQMWVAQAYPFSRPRQLLTSGGLGTMGFGLPSAIGASLQFPSKPVICFSGDGSFLMNLQELATADEENVNVKIVLMNNRALGLVHQQQDLFYGRRHFASVFRSNTDFSALAQSFGVCAFDLERSSDPLITLATALKTEGPVLIHCPIEVQEKVFPMVPPGAANKDMICAKSLQQVS